MAESISSICTEVFKFDDGPKELFHYTSLAGLKGIVENRSLWGTNYRYLNDSAEIKDMFQVLIDSTRYQDSEFSKKTPEDLMKELYSNYPIPNHMITSFSENSDDLAMWGRYANDSGVAIGFENVSASKWCPRETKHEPYFGKCIYDINEKEEILSKLLTFGRDIDSILNALAQICPYFKNGSFAGEKEWRIVSYCHLDKNEGSAYPQFRVSQNKLVPYFNVTTNKPEDFRFTKIVLSPKLSQDPMGKTSIEDFLNTSGIEYDSIELSHSTLV